MDGAVTIEGMTSLGYDPLAHAPWHWCVSTTTGTTTAVTFAAVANVFSAIESTTKRLLITAVLTNFLRSIIAISPEDLLPVVYLCSNGIAPAFESVELGVGDSILVKALAEATGRQPKDIKSDMDEKGDLGLVAEASRSKQKTLSFGGMVMGGTGKAGGSAAGGMTARHVYETFRSIALESGKSSQEKKAGSIKRMLVKASGAEARFLVRALQGSLRIGLAKQTVLVSLAQAFAITSPYEVAWLQSESADEDAVTAPQVKELGGHEIVAAPGLPASLLLPRTVKLYRRVAPSTAPTTSSELVLDMRRHMSESAMEARLQAAATVLKQVYSELPSYDSILPALLAGGIPQARRVCALTAGIPVTPMLAKPTKGVREVLTRFEAVDFTCEWKYDGERAQVHRQEGGQIGIFSRNSEDTSGKYPDLGIVLKEAMGGVEGGEATAVHSCVLDGEVVAYDREKHSLMPFQILSTRARKDVEVADIKVQVIYVAFDLLYLNGISLLHTPLSIRRAILKQYFKEVPGRFTFATAAESNDVEEIGAFLNDAVKGGCEGLMVKVLNGPDAVYEPSKRSLNWLKLKKDYMDGLTDSLDLVPIAAWLGKGKRTGTYGAYLLACYDPEEEVYQAITKIGTGFSDEMLTELTTFFKESGCIRESKPMNVLAGDGMDADVWFDPDHSQVWEVMAADLSISPVHKAALGKVDSGKGIALRFPRFLRRRDDKSPNDATSSDQVADMYRSQSSTVATKNDEEDWDM